MKTPAGLLPSSARSRGLVQLAPAGEARPRVRNVGSARPAGGGGWGGGNARGLAGAHGHPRALLAHGASELSPRQVRPRASRPAWRGEDPRAPRIPAPPPCDSGGGGEGLLICSGGEAREPRRKRDARKPSETPTTGEMKRDWAAEKPRNGRECGTETEGGPETEKEKEGSVRTQRLGERSDAEAGPGGPHTTETETRGRLPAARRGREAPPGPGPGRKESPTWMQQSLNKHLLINVRMKADQNRNMSETEAGGRQRRRMSPGLLAQGGHHTPARMHRSGHRPGRRQPAPGSRPPAHSIPGWGPLNLTLILPGAASQPQFLV